MVCRIFPAELLLCGLIIQVICPQWTVLLAARRWSPHPPFVPRATLLLRYSLLQELGQCELRAGLAAGGVAGDARVPAPAPTIVPLVCRGGVGPVWHAPRSALLLGLAVSTAPLAGPPAHHTAALLLSVDQARVATAGTGGSYICPHREHYFCCAEKSTRKRQR